MTLPLFVSKNNFLDEYFANTYGKVLLIIIFYFSHLGTYLIVIEKLKRIYEYICMKIIVQQHI